MHRIPPPVLEPVRAALFADGPAWLADAACLGAVTERWFDPDPSDAVAICRGCPVAGACADHAIAERIDLGVWGGMTAADRRQVAELRGIVWPPEPPPARVACRCGRLARPSRTECAGCAQRRYRAGRR